jgi:hypothetical protein
MRFPDINRLLTGYPQDINILIHRLSTGIRYLFLTIYNNFAKVIHRLLTDTITIYLNVFKFI